jgi:RNA polymerase primary sigma factor
MGGGEDQVRLDIRPVLSESAQRELCGRLREPRARAKLVEANTSFVRSIAGEYIGRGLPLPDLFQEGCVGLITAADRFDPSRGHNFITYAVWWIRQSIRKALADHSRTVRVPVSRQQRYTHIQNRLWARAQEQLEMPSRDEIVREFPGDAERAVMVRIDRIAGADGRGDSLTESLPGPDRNPLAGIEEEERAALVADLLRCLRPRHAELIKMRFGLGNDRPMVLREVGERFGVSRERVRQIEAKALTALREAIQIIADEI